MKFKDDLEYCYLLEAVKKNFLNIILHMSVLLAAAFACYHIASNLDFTMIVQREIIPSRLIDIQAFRENISDYIIKKNTSPAIISQTYSLVKNLSALSTAVCIILIVSFVSWLKGISAASRK